MFVTARDGQLRSCNGQTMGRTRADNSRRLVRAKTGPKPIPWLAMAYTPHCMENAHADVTRCGIEILFWRSDFPESRRTFNVTLLPQGEAVLVSRPNSPFFAASLNVTQFAQLYSSSVNKPSDLYILSARLGCTCNLCIQNLPLPTSPFEATPKYILLDQPIPESTTIVKYTNNKRINLSRGSKH
jgi:hypothetical protein